MGVENIISAIIGWIYCIVWTISFYPQIWYNYKTKSITGLSVDFVVGNAVGFIFLTIYNAFFLWNEYTRALYRDKHDGYDNVAQINDFIFSLHASLISLFCLYQVILYRKPNEGMTITGKIAFLLLILWVIVTGEFFILGIWTFLEVLYSLAFVKTVITVVKYLPQVYMNYTRKSTMGWSIWMVLGDFIGSTFSIAQLILDSFLSRNLDNITGNIVKLSIGVISLFFDIIFMIQHYILYRDPKDTP